MWGFQFGYYKLLPVLIITLLLAIVLAELVFVEKMKKMRRDSFDTFMESHRQKPPDHYRSE